MDLQTATPEELMDRLIGLLANQRRRKEDGQEGLAASYGKPINEVCDEIKRRGGDVIEWLDVAEPEAGICNAGA